MQATNRTTRNLAPVPPLGTRLWRGARLKCPVCGGGGVLDGWMKVKRRCPTCGLRLERGEHDFFLGGMVFNIALAEGTLALVLVGVIIALWPNVPWLFLEIGGPLLMIVAPSRPSPGSSFACRASPARSGPPSNCGHASAAPAEP